VESAPQGQLGRHDGT